MAVIEIAKIQVRRGQENQTGVPILDSGELGWASDTEKLYIGLRRVDGGSRDANVRILTENDLRNFFQSSVVSNLSTTTVYTFKKGTWIATSSTSVIGPPDPEVQRTVQGKLDDYVSIKDFGAAGDGLNDDSGAIQNAIENLYLYDRWANDLGLLDGNEKVLFFPEGNYVISRTIYIPAKTKIRGEGVDSTIITLIATGTHFFQTIDGNSQANNPIHFDNTGNFSVSGPMGSPAPDNINIEKLTLQHNVSTASGLSFISLDVSQGSIIRDVKFVGTYTSTSVISSSTYVGIDLRGYGAATTENLVIENCQFEQLYYGIKSNYDVKDIVINGCTFDILNKGVAFNDPIAAPGSANDGPKSVKIINSKFYRIANQGIYVGVNNNLNASHIVSQNNRFADVGNSILGTEYGVTGTSVIYYGTRGNISQNDHFERLYSVYNAIDTNTTTVVHPWLDGNGILDFTYSVSRICPPGTTTTVFVIPITQEFQNIELKYSLNGSTIDRQGDMRINVRSGSNPEVAIEDRFNYAQNFLSEDLILDTDPIKKFSRIQVYNPPQAGLGLAVSLANAPYPVWTGSTSTGTYTNLTIINTGSGFIVGDTVTLLGQYFTTGTFVATSANNVTLTVTGVSTGGGVTAATFIGTPTNIINTFTVFFSGLASTRPGGPGVNLVFEQQARILYS